MCSSIFPAMQLAEVVVGRPRVVYGRFQRLGTYSQNQVEDAADKNGRVMALRFVNTELLEDPVSLDQTREMAAGLGESFNAPPSPQPVSEQLFKEVYQQASTYGR